MNRELIKAKAKELKELCLSDNKVQRNRSRDELVELITQDVKEYLGVTEATVKVVYNQENNKWFVSIQDAPYTQAHAEAIEVHRIRDGMILNVYVELVNIDFKRTIMVAYDFSETLLNLLQ